MKKIMIALIVLLCGTISVFSQSRSQNMVDVNGIVLWEKYTDAQIRQLLGEPTTVELWGDAEFGMGEEKVYNFYISDKDRVDFVKFSTSGEFIGFNLKSPRFKLYNGRIKVGGFVGVFYNLGFGHLSQSGVGEYRFYDSTSLGEEGYLVIKTTSLGVITHFYYYFPS